MILKSRCPEWVTICKEKDMRHEVYCQDCEKWIDIRDIEVKVLEESLYREEYMTFSCLSCDSDNQRSLIRVGY